MQGSAAHERVTCAPRTHASSLHPRYASRSTSPRGSCLVWCAVAALLLVFLPTIVLLGGSAWLLEVPEALIRFYLKGWARGWNSKAEPSRCTQQKHILIMHLIARTGRKTTFHVMIALPTCGEAFRQCYDQLVDETDCWRKGGKRNAPAFVSFASARNWRGQQADAPQSTNLRPESRCAHTRRLDCPS